MLSSAKNYLTHLENQSQEGYKNSYIFLTFPVYKRPPGFLPLTKCPRLMCTLYAALENVRCAKMILHIRRYRK